MNLPYILLIFAFVCATLAAFGVPSGRFNLTAASLAFYFASLVFRAALVSLLLLSLASCATDPNGVKTFAGLDARGALYLARDVTGSYLSHSKPSGKSAKDVLPVESTEPTANEQPWYLKLLGL